MARAACLLPSLLFGFWSSTPFWGGSVAIEHDPVDCVIVDQFPQIDVRLDPMADVHQAHIFFKSEGALDWYSVPMEPEAGVFRGFLPKPTEELERFEYYIEVTDETYASSRTEEFSAAVVGGTGNCDGRLATYVGSALVTIRLPGIEGAPMVPPGFSSVGVVTAAATGAAAAGAAAAGASAGGGLSATTIGLIAGGGAAAAAGVAVAAGGGSSGAEPEDEVLETGLFEGTTARTTTTWRISEEAYSGCSYTASWDTAVSMSIGEGEDVAVFSFTNITLSTTPGTMSSRGIPCDQATVGSPAQATVPLVVSGARVSGSGQTDSGNSIIEIEATRSRSQISGSYTWRPNPDRRFAGSDPVTTPFTLTKTR